jgi:hypothetical protein
MRLCLSGSLVDAHEAIDAYMRHYNEQRIRLALNYRTLREVTAAFLTRAAA